MSEKYKQSLKNIVLINLLLDMVMQFIPVFIYSVATHTFFWNVVTYGMSATVFIAITFLLMFIIPIVIIIKKKYITTGFVDSNNA